MRARRPYHTLRETLTVNPFKICFLYNMFWLLTGFISMSSLLAKEHIDKRDKESCLTVSDMAFGTDKLVFINSLDVLRTLSAN